MTDQAVEADPRVVRRAAVLRLVTGLAQGLLLYWLYQADEFKRWPDGQPMVYAAFLLAVLFAPFVVLAGLSTMRWPALAAWKGVVVLLAAGVGAYGVWSGDPSASGVNGLGPLSFLGVAALIFIGHHLVEPADIERRPIARFASYFDITWKHGVQLALAVGFTGAFWLLLWLAAVLFKLIGVGIIETVIQTKLFAIPATTTIFAAAVQLTDVRAGLVRGVRTVALTLLAWLLPLMVLIAGAFLLTLPFTGLEPLWKTRSATASLLTAAAFLVLLTNAAYQDGTETTALILKWAARLAGLLLVPITVLAAYGLSLRIGQYGLSPDRIIAAACVLVAAGYAIGYAVAAVRPGPWLKTLETTNIGMAFVVIVVLLALVTPLADPRRLSVNDQVARLQAGKVKAEAFDFDFLRFRSGRFGLDALKRLAAGPDALVAKAAKASLARLAAGPAPGKAEPMADVIVYPKGRTLPNGFERLADLSDSPCRFAAKPCSALLLDIDADGSEEVLLSSGSMLDVFGMREGRWKKIGYASSPCGRVADIAGVLARSGEAATVAPSPLRDVVLGDIRMEIRPQGDACNVTAEEALASRPKPPPR